MCRRHLSCQDKRVCITGEQFTRVMQNILLSDIENKPECVQSIYDAYGNVEEEHEIVTAEHVYEEIFAWRENKLSWVEDGYFDSEDQKIIREYTEIIDVCKRYFGFV
jgi:transcription elongation factor GreA-like protein